MTQTENPTGPGLKTFFDPEHVERPAPDRPWRALALGAVLAAAAATIGWEVYWRANWFEAGDINNSDGLWAQERRKAAGEATVLIGSSRILFDVDLDVWEQTSGVRPIQLAMEGTSPRLFLKDLAADESFTGLLLVGVTAPLFFTQEGGLRTSALDRFKDESLSQRADHWLSLPLDHAFAFIDDVTRPKFLISTVSLPLRAGMKPKVVIRKLSEATQDRNTQMWRRVEKDPAFQQLARDNWVALITAMMPAPGPNGEPPPPMPDAAIDAVVAEVKAGVDAIRARGGDVAFLRLPYDGFFAQVEDAGFPRERFWNRLLEGTQSAGVAWQDHPELQGYHLAEWSHLTASEAERYTSALVPIVYERLDIARDAR